MTRQEVATRDEIAQEVSSTHDVLGATKGNRIKRQIDRRFGVEVQHRRPRLQEPKVCKHVASRAASIAPKISDSALESETEFWVFEAHATGTPMK